MRDKTLCEKLAEVVAREYCLNGEGCEVHVFEIGGMTIRVTVEEDMETAWEWNQAQITLPQNSG